MKKRSKILCMVLSMIMLLNFVPTVAFAAQTTVTLTVSVDNPANSGGNVGIQEKGGQGTMSYEDNIPLNAGRTVNFYPGTGYEIDTVTVDGTVVTVTNNTLALTMDSDKTVKVKFKQITSSGTNSTSFSVKQEDEYGNALSGAHFILSDDSRQIDNITAISGNDGVANFTNVPDGTYTLYESLSPYGYIKSDAEYTVTINTSTAATDTITIVDIISSASNSYSDGETIATFKNEEDVNYLSVKFPITKTISGNGAPATQRFQFEILRIIGEDSNGQLLFEVIDTTAPNKSQFTYIGEVVESEQNNIAIREKKENITGWTFDDSVYFVDIDPTKADNYGIIAATYTKAGDQSGTIYDRAIFENTYGTGGSASTNTIGVAFPIIKIIDGNNAPATQKFQFEVLRITGNNQGQPTFEVIATSAPNKSTFTFVDQIPESEKDNIAIREKKEDIAGWVFDDKVYYVKLDPSNKDNFGNYIAKYTMVGGQSNVFSNRALFTNTYVGFNMDGNSHWPSNNPQDKQNHTDSDRDNICDVCGYNIVGTPGGSNSAPSGISSTAISSSAAPASSAARPAATSSSAAISRNTASSNTISSSVSSSSAIISSTSADSSNSDSAPINSDANSPDAENSGSSLWVIVLLIFAACAIAGITITIKRKNAK